MTNVVELNSKRSSVEYTVKIIAHWNGTYEIGILGLGDPPSEENKTKIVEHLHGAIRMIERSKDESQ